MKIVRHKVDIEKGPAYGSMSCQRLRFLMEVEEVYRDHEMDLEYFSNLVGLSKRNTSRLIKNCFCQSFTAFINTYRLRKVIQKIDQGDYQLHTIFGIAQEAGFPSKSTFYRVFKQKLDRCPSDYLKE